MDLRERLNQLTAESNPLRRGKHFEPFLARMLEEDDFDVTYNPKAAFHGHGGLNCVPQHFLRYNTLVLESASLFSTS
jgi:hypothetical protein